MIKYSFIVPVYNGEKYLENCIESILNQETEASFEIILVNDGSVDRSEEICSKYEVRFSNIRYISKENGGAASARNAGIDAAAGEYLIFIDDDDTIEMSLLKDLDALTGSTDMVVYGMSFDYYRDERIVRNELLSNKHSGTVAISDICENFEEYFSDNALSSVCNKVFRASIINDNDLRFKEGMNLYEDLEFVIRYMKAVDSVGFTNKVYYHYRIFDGTGNLGSRVSDIYKLKVNMGLLLDTLNDLNIKKVGEFGFELYLDMLNMHFSLMDVSLQDIARDSGVYLEGMGMNEDLSIKNERSRWLLNGEYERYYRDLKNRKRKSAVKKKIKKVIGR